MAPSNLVELLEEAASHSNQSGITFYAPGNITDVSQRLSYDDLLRSAREKALLIRQIPQITPKTKFLLHLDNQFDGLQFFWAIVVAGFVPAISTPFTNDIEQRKKHVSHLQNLLEKPVIITAQRLVSEFAGLHDDLNVWTIEKIQSQYYKSEPVSSCVPVAPKQDDLAALMLTSGSTGNAKAVTLRHAQVLESLKGKAAHHGTRSSDVFLNWIGLDHVANLTEVHLHAMSLAAEQVQVGAADVIANPTAFIKLLDKHRVAFTFAPNFFLASLKKTLEGPRQDLQDIDLCCLRAFISGGEANVTETCEAVTRLLGQYGAPTSFIRPGFGMTETCAGSIYNKKCPRYDIARGTEFTSLGSPVPGLQMRVTREDRSLADTDEVGSLELSGPIVFQEYYNNPTATASTFTPDGWFITGDKAYLDVAGQLNLSGRAKESIIINGVKHFPHEIESALEDASIDGITPSYTAIFPHRPKGSSTEVICIVYLPTYEQDDVATRIAVRRAVSEVSVRQTGARPFRILPLTKDLLPKSTLGKLSRVKIQTAFNSGAFSRYEELDDRLVRGWQSTHMRKPSTETEKILYRVFLEVLEVPEIDLSIDTSVFEMGISSIEILKMKTAIEKALPLKTDLAIITIMANPSVRSLAVALTADDSPKTYNPAITLSTAGQRTPLWLVHPGVGEVLIFLDLAKRINDRPVYALRARGFDGEPFFQNMQEYVSTYHAAIKRLQPNGPYAFLGYSFGGFVSFELAKAFEKAGDEVRFLGIMDIPPNASLRMGHSNWTNVVLIIAVFLSIIDSKQAAELGPSLRDLPQDAVLDRILSYTTPAHLQAMAINKEKLSRWAALALNNHTIGKTYSPEGKIQSLDMFYAASPDPFYKLTVEEMLEQHFRPWSNYAETANFHCASGTHNDMILPANVAGFHKMLIETLKARGC